MHLLYDHQIFQAQQYGGISRYFVELITRMAVCEQADVSLFLGFYINQYGVENYRGYFHNYFGIERPMLPRTGRLFSATNAHVFSSVIQRWRPDIYHQTYFDRVAPEFEGKRVVTVYDMIHELYPHFYRSNDRTRENKARAVQEADQVIAISHSTRADLMKVYGVPSEKIRVIHLANSLTKEVTEPSLIPDPYVLFVGARLGYKNFLLCLDAIAKVAHLPKKLKLVCFGGGPLNAEEQEKIRKLGLADRLVLIAGGGDHVLAQLYKYAEFFVYPSHYEGFGIPILEAMKYGCPVVICASSSLKEVGGDAAVFFKQSNSDDLALKMEMLLSDAKTRNQAATAGLLHEAKFSWQRTFQQTLETYLSLV